VCSNPIIAYHVPQEDEPTRREVGAVMPNDFRVEPLTDGDRSLVETRWRAAWGGSVVVSRGRVHRPADVAGFKAVDDAGALLGLVTYRRTEPAPELEVVSLDSDVEGRGVGTALLARVMEVARTEGLVRVWLITTNDNVDALRFYQRRGFRLVALHLDAVAAARAVKPSIPERGPDGVPLRDEWELEWRVDAEPR